MEKAILFYKSNFSIFILFLFWFDIHSSNYFSIWQWQVRPTVLFHHQIWQGSSWNVVCKSSNFVLWAFYCLFLCPGSCAISFIFVEPGDCTCTLLWNQHIYIFEICFILCFTMSVYRSPKSSYQKLFLAH